PSAPIPYSRSSVPPCRGRHYRARRAIPSGGTAGVHSGWEDRCGRPYPQDEVPRSAPLPSVTEVRVLPPYHVLLTSTIEPHYRCYHHSMLPSVQERTIHAPPMSVSFIHRRRPGPAPSPIACEQECSSAPPVRSQGHRDRDSS